MSYFGISGLNIPTMSEILTAVKTRFKTAWGTDIRVDDPDGVFGRLAAILSEIKNDVLAELTATAAALLPSTSMGALLSEIVKFNGITRNVASHSTVTVTLSATAGAGTTIPNGALVGTSTGAQFEISGPVVIAAGLTDTALATAVEEGSVEAAATHLNQILTPVYGWESVNNVLDATLGDAVESDPALRARRWAAAVAVGLHHPSIIYKVLADLDDVTDTYVEVNNGTTTNSNGVPSGHIRAILIGGTDQDIADTLFGIHPLGALWPQGAGSIAGGIGSHGDEHVVATDSETGQTETMNFDRGVLLPIWITVNTVLNGSYPTDGNDQIKAAILEFFAGTLTIDGITVEKFKLGETVVSSRLYTPCNKVIGHSVREVLIGTSSGPNSQADIVLLLNQLATTDVDKIVINPI